MSPEPLTSPAARAGGSIIKRYPVDGNFCVVCRRSLPSSWDGLCGPHRYEDQPEEAS